MIDGKPSYDRGMKRLMISRTLVSFCAIFLAVAFTFFVCFFALARTAAEAHRLTVVIDAGHGGVDGGVTGILSGKKESDLNLAVSRFLQAELEDAGLCVVQTRLTEAGLYGAATPGYKKRDMQKRAEIIKNANPALVISIHQNFYSSSTRRGGQVFFKSSSKSAQTLACMIQNSINDMEECVRKYQPLVGDYYVLNCSDYPSVIVEGGFLSNAEDEALLTNPHYQKKLAQAICEGALSFLASAANG